MTPGLPGFYHLTALGVAASTNDVALARAAEGAAEGTLITAVQQTAGRGRRGRSWISPAGNLYLSVILSPGADAAGAVGFAASLAAAAAVAQYAPERDVAVKWPNDVLLDGAKVAGLLIEAVPGRAGMVVLGVGINVAHHPSDTPYPATSMVDAGAMPGVDELRDTFCARFLDLYQGLRRDGFAPLRAAWLARASGVGGPITVNLEGARYDGTFAGLDESGALMLDQGASGMRKITAGDVFFAGA
jgi:BirA family biotin operon repressor/biotin-[acetyl-CoA-carboxylase] ligase